MLIAETITKHLGMAAQRPAQTPTTRQSSPIDPSFSVDVVYTEPEATGASLRAAALLAQDLHATIHLRALICVPRQLSLADPPVSISYFGQLLGDLVERFGSAPLEHVLHIYICRSRIETLLGVLGPASLVVVGGRRRPWPTPESRLSKAAYAAGHSVAFVDPKACCPEVRWL